MPDTLDVISQAKEKLKELAEERESIYQRQVQYRATMQTLNTTGDEAALRKRFVGQLEES